MLKCMASHGEEGFSYLKAKIPFLLLELGLQCHVTGITEECSQLPLLNKGMVRIIDEGS